MKVEFSETFFKSFKKMINKQRWYWKTWDFFRYDLPNFFRNIWLFRKNLWNHTWYNGDGSILPWVKTAVDDMAWRIEKNGKEIESSRMKKVEKMKRLSYLIDVCVNDKYTEIAEEELGKMIFHNWEFEPVEGNDDLFQLKDKETPEEKEHNRKVLDRSRQIQKEQWNEFCHIIKGLDYDELKDDNVDWDKWYDGTDIRAWCD